MVVSQSTEISSSTVDRGKDKIQSAVEISWLIIVIDGVALISVGSALPSNIVFEGGASVFG